MNTSPSSSASNPSPQLTLGVLVLVALLAGGGYFGFTRWRDSQQNQAGRDSWSLKAKIKPSGGRAFRTRLELPVPQFSQADPKWAGDILGLTQGTLATTGSALASTAMVLASYGIDTDPKRLNAHLAAHEGFTPDGGLKGEAAATIAPDRVAFVYEDLPRYQLIVVNLAEGNPVIVRLRQPSGTTHHVVICGKDGADYLIRDPGAEGTKGVYPLKDLCQEIESLRFYGKFLPDPQPAAGGRPEKPAGK